MSRKGLLAVLTIIMSIGPIPAQNKPAAFPAATLPAIATISPDDLMKHVKTVSSDEFEGRYPGTKGEELTVGYVTEQLKQYGLKPGNPDGSYTQAVALIGRASTGGSASFEIKGQQV